MNFFLYYLASHLNVFAKRKPDNSHLEIEELSFMCSWKGAWIFKCLSLPLLT
jgi:hypothetical protein